MKKLFFTLALASMVYPALANNDFQEEKKMILSAITESEDEATIQNISSNGLWAVGYSFDNSDNAAFNRNASKWDLTKGERILLVEDPTAQSEANCINNDGTIVGGAYLNQPAYNLNGEWHTLELPTGYTMGTVKDMTITPDGDTIFVGYVLDNAQAQAAEAAKWVNGVYETANPRSLRYDKFDEPATLNTCYNISEDGKTILGSLEFNAKPHQSAFIVTPDTAYLIDTETESNRNMSFIFAPRMSDNGKYVAGSFRKVVFNEGDEFSSVDIYQPCIFDVEKQRLQVLDCEFECGAWDVDNNGYVYVNSPVETSAIRQAYIYKNNEWIEIERIIRPAGIKQSEIEAVANNYNEEGNDNLGTLLAVSADGKVIIGCAGECKTYNWVLAAATPLNEFETIEVSNNPISYDNLAAFYQNNTIILSGMVDAIEVYDINGKMVMNQMVESAFVPTQLENGIYIVKIYNNKNNTICTSKIIVK